MVTEAGEVRQGSLARIEPEGDVVRMWEAIETYMERKQPLIIVAGAITAKAALAIGRQRAFVWRVWKRLLPRF